MGNQATREGRPMDRMVETTVGRLSGKGVTRTLGTGTPKEDGSGSGTECREFPFLILCFALHD